MFNKKVYVVLINYNYKSFYLTLLNFYIKMHQELLLQRRSQPQQNLYEINATVAVHNFINN